MPGSSSYVPSPLPGLALKAWAIVSGGGGGVLKGFNVASASRTGTGQLAITLTNPNAGTAALVQVIEQHQSSTAHTFNFGVVVNTTTAISLWTLNASTPTDYGLLYIAVYEAP